MISQGNPDEGKTLLASIDESQVKEAAIFVNVGINLLNQNKANDALPFLDKAINRFPDAPDAYYYRGITYIQLSHRQGGPDNKEEADKLLAAGKADLDQVRGDGTHGPRGRDGEEDAGAAEVARPLQGRETAGSRQRISAASTPAACYFPVSRAPPPSPVPRSGPLGTPSGGSTRARDRGRSRCSRVDHRRGVPVALALHEPQFERLREVVVGGLVIRGNRAPFSNVAMASFNAPRRPGSRRARCRPRRPAATASRPRAASDTALPNSLCCT